VHSETDASLAPYWFLSEFWNLI